MNKRKFQVRRTIYDKIRIEAENDPSEANEDFVFFCCDFFLVTLSSSKDPPSNLDIADKFQVQVFSLPPGVQVNPDGLKELVRFMNFKASIFSFLL